MRIKLHMESWSKMDKESTGIQSSCEYKALKACLDKNQGRREKCEKEWLDFQNQCAAKKR